MVASNNSRIEVVKLLLDRGTNINHKANNGWTSLMWVSSGGHTTIAKLLLDMGVDVHHKTNDGESIIES
jgi:ankyrin repeat protein